MLPYLHIGPITLASYGTSIIIGVLCAALLLRFRSRQKELPYQDALSALFYGLVGLFVGAKLFYLAQAMPHLIEHWGELVSDPGQLLGLIFEGFVFYGGLFGGIAGVAVYARQYRLSFRKLLELLIPVVPLIHAFGRIGCFLAGCCYGIPCDGPLCLTFPTEGIEPAHTSLFPVQLLESALLLLLTAFLLLYEARAKKPLSLVGLYLLLYGVIRMATEMFRGDLIRGSFLFFSTSQWISVILIVVAVVVLVKCGKGTSDCVKTQNKTDGDGAFCHVLQAKRDKNPPSPRSHSEFSHSLPSPCALHRRISTALFPTRASCI